MATARPDTLLLPTEVVFEPYRSPEIRGNAEWRHNAIIRILRDADRLFVYGLSLASEDAELLQILTAGLHQSSVHCIEIIDPEHERVAQRVMALMHRELLLIGRAPTELEKPARTYDGTPATLVTATPHSDTLPNGSRS